MTQKIEAMDIPNTHFDFSYNETWYKYYVNNSGDIIRATFYCNDDDDCSGLDHYCYNKNTPKFSDYFNNSMKTDTNCICKSNNCVASELAEYYKKIIEPNSKIMMWWDYGRYLDVAGFESIVLNPSTPILHTVSRCSLLREYQYSCFDYLHHADPQDRVSDVARFFTTNNSQEALCIAYKYDVDYVIIDSSMIGKYAVIGHAVAPEVERWPTLIWNNDHISIMGGYNQECYQSEIVVLNNSEDNNPFCRLISDYVDEEVFIDVSQVFSTFTQLYYFNGDGLPEYVKIDEYKSSFENTFILFEVKYPQDIQDLCS
ncbi:hypothetical protein K9M79_05200 [Candidatus Woesearchaeota archaeon]|nr:hypothetical protein [Candidatus Woesearchaeota archaeon]